MTRSRQTTIAISNALRSIDRSLVPEDCATEVYYDPVGRCWYAQFITVATINTTAGHQSGNLGQGFSPLAAVQELMALNSKHRNDPRLKDSSYD